MSEVTMAAISPLCARVQQIPDIGTPQCFLAFFPKSPSLLVFSSPDLAVLEGSFLIFCLGIILFSILFRMWEWETIHQPTQEWVSNHGGEEQLNCHHLWWALSHLPEGLFLPGGQDQPSFPKGSKFHLYAHDGQWSKGWLHFGSLFGLQRYSLLDYKCFWYFLRKPPDKWWGIVSCPANTWWILCPLKILW